MTRTARAFWTVGPGEGAIREVSLPAPGPGDVVVDAAAGCISRGTEALVFAGRVPETERERMRAPFQEGAFPWPVKYGYATVGRVAAGPGVGAAVFCLHPHQTRFVVPAAAAVPVPDDVPVPRAVLAANAETALNALWDLGPRIGERITVVGGGVVGCLVAWLAARVPGADVELVDPVEGRARVAAALGARWRRPADATPDRDAVLHASGTGAGLRRSLELVRDEGPVVELSWYGDGEPPVPLGRDFHARRLRLLSSQVGRVAPAMRHRFDHRDRLALALRLLSDPAVDALFDGESAFDDLPETLPRLVAASPPGLAHRVVYPQATATAAPTT